MDTAATAADKAIEEAVMHLSDAASPESVDPSSRLPISVVDVFNHYYLQFVRMAWLLVGNRDVAEDVVQDAFVRCERRWDRVDPTKVVGYVRAAVLNGARTKLRQRRRAAARDIQIVPSEASDTAQAVIERENRHRIVAAVRRLPPRQRDVVMLRFFEDLSLAEIAEVLGISLGAVKGSLSRAKGTLRATIGAER